MSKTVLITGSSSGIGADIALNLSKSGYKVFLSGRDKLKLEKHAKTCQAMGYLAGDLTERGFVNSLYKVANEQLNGIDILINNAGIYIWSPIDETDEGEIRKTYQLNLQVPYELCKLVVPEMKNKHWGRIVNIGSISGAVGEANASLYSSSKSGLAGLTKSLALELAEYNITINLINPGWVETRMIESVFDNEILDKSEQIDMIPQKRFIEAYEVSALVKYIISEEAKGITGQSINICGGLSLG